MSDPTYVPPSRAKTGADLSRLTKAVNTVQSIDLGAKADTLDLTEAQRRDIEAVVTIDLSNAKQLAACAYSGIVPAEALYIMHQKARNAAVLLATKAQLIYADALDNPGDYKASQLRQCEKLMDMAQLKWPEAPPQTDTQRLEQMTQADVGAMTDADLKAKLAAALKQE